MTNKRIYTTIFLGLLLTCIVVLTGCSTSDGQDGSPHLSIAVEVQEVQLGSTEQQISFSGTIEEALSVPLSFSVPGTVSEVFVHEGETVQKGQVLAILNSESWQNSLEMARAKAEQAEDAYRRMLPMHKKGSLPEIKFVEVETGLQEARSALAMAQKNFDDCKLLATVDGIVGQRSIEPGMSVMPSVNTITLVRIDTVYARISVSEGEIATIKEGMTADVIVSALEKARFSGVVAQIGVMADPLMHTYKAKILIPNQDHALLPGMLCNVALAVSHNQACFVVPTGCLFVDENGGHYLFVADTVKHIALRQDVTLGSFAKTGVEIRTGLQAGARVVVAGQQKLSDQTSISYSR